MMPGEITPYTTSMEMLIPITVLSVILTPFVTVVTTLIPKSGFTSFRVDIMIPKSVGLGKQKEKMEKGSFEIESGGIISGGLYFNIGYDIIQRGKNICGK